MADKTWEIRFRDLKLVDNGDGTYSLAVSGQSALVAGENHIGAVGGHTTIATATPVVSTSPSYSANDQVGGLLAFTGAARVAGGSGVIHSVTITDKAKQDATLDLYLFDSNPTSTTFTDNAALTINAADLIKSIGVIRVSTYQDVATNSVGGTTSTGVPFKLVSGTTLYGALVTRGTPTYASTSDLQVRLGILQD